MQFQLLSDLRDAVKECLDVDCEYKFFISLGEPPADCNSIAFWYSESRRNRDDNNECSTTVFDSEVNVTITRCCVTADGQVEFNYAQEEKDAQCFLADLEALIACLSCNGNTILSDYIASCGVTIDRVDMSRSKMGGCYDATIELSFAEEVCCDG